MNESATYYEEKAEEAVSEGRPDRAQVYATLAVAAKTHEQAVVLDRVADVLRNLDDNLCGSLR